jgi:hypothetical protein
MYMFFPHFADKFGFDFLRHNKPFALINYRLLLGQIDSPVSHYIMLNKRKLIAAAIRVPQAQGTSKPKWSS